MREIKFRAWEKESKVMIPAVSVYDPGDHIGFSETTAVDAFGDKWDNFESTHMEMGDDWVYLLGGFELMQFTGLKDKNGKDIYEGDILSSKSFPRSPNGGWYCDGYGHQKGTGRIIAFEKGEFRADTDSLWEVLNLRPNHTWEVIGNIYENTELLEVKP